MLLAAGWLCSTQRKVAARRCSSGARFCRQWSRPRLLSSMNMHTVGEGTASVPVPPGTQGSPWGQGAETDLPEGPQETAPVGAEGQAPFTPSTMAAAVVCGVGVLGRSLQAKPPHSSQSLPCRRLVSSRLWR